MTFFELRWLYHLFGQVWIWCRRKWIWAFYPFERLVFKNVLKILLINIWIFIPLLTYMWGVEGVTEYKCVGQIDSTSNSKLANKSPFLVSPGMSILLSRENQLIRLGSCFNTIQKLRLSNWCQRGKFSR